jgi:transcriptional regulator with XRE-family HTH domain
MDSPLAEGFGRNLWRHRRRCGLSQEELGALVELHRTEISMLERGRQLPRADTILKLAAGLQISPGELLIGLRWWPGHYVDGEFEVRDGSQWAARAKEE